jgi:hypothetical protein
MPARSEVGGHGAIRRQKALGMPGGCEPLHATLALTRRPMRALIPIIEGATLTMCYAWQYCTLGRAGALAFIRHDDARHRGEALEQLAQALRGGLFVPSALHQDIQHVVILIDGAPRVKRESSQTP